MSAGGRLLRSVLLAACLAVGAGIGLVGAFVQAQRIVSGLTIPWGVPLVWLVLVLAVRAGTWAVGSRWGGWGVATGWVAATVLLATESPSGDLAIAGGGRQLVYLFGGVVLVSFAATLPLPRDRRMARSDHGPDHGSDHGSSATGTQRGPAAS